MKINYLILILLLMGMVASSCVYESKPKVGFGEKCTREMISRIKEMKKEGVPQAEIELLADAIYKDCVIRGFGF